MHSQGHLTSLLNSHQKQHLFGLFRFRGNQEGGNDASLDVQDVLGLLLVWVKQRLFPFANDQPELGPVPERVCSRESFSLGGLLA